jgi:trans-aconitate methyltransferase
VSRAKAIARVMQITAEKDRQWMGKVPGAGDARHTPWMPFPIPEFITLLAQAVAEAPGEQFLEIGCGIGTRMMLAREIFGLDVTGIERVPEYVAECRRLALDAEEADAGHYNGYGKFDIIWFNRPFRDQSRQAALEKKVWAETRPGAVVMCANLEDPPPSSWFIIEDDWEVRRGVWQKPYISTAHRP